LGGLGTCLLLAPALAACGSSKNTQGTNCPAGAETCACFANHTCLDGLTCLSEVCVSLAGTGGATSSGAGGTSSTDTGGGANQDTGGADPGAGGSTGATGGSDPGAGGTLSTTGGADPGTGGIPASGGASQGAGGTLSATGGVGVTTGGTVSATGGAGTGGAGTLVLGTNLIKDPEFSNVSGYWMPTINSGDDGYYQCTGGQCCLYNESGVWISVSLGYPRSVNDAFALDSGATYRFSFRAKGLYVSEVEAKIGGAVSPYTTVFSKLLTVSSSTTEYSYTFTTSAAATSVGLVFNVELEEYGEACFSLVSLTKV